MCRTALVVLLLLCTGCAVFNHDNRRTLNALDEHVAPGSSAGRWVLSPVGLPVGLIAGALDMLVVHPATVFDDAWADTRRLLWSPRGESRFRRALMLPLVTVATPIVYLGDWLMRSLFDVPAEDGD